MDEVYHEFLELPRVRTRAILMTSAIYGRQSWTASQKLTIRTACMAKQLHEHGRGHSKSGKINVSVVDNVSDRMAGVTTVF